MKKQSERNYIRVLAGLIVTASVLFGCARQKPVEQKIEDKIFFQLGDGAGNADAKLFGERVLYIRDGSPLLLNENGKIVQDYPEIRAQWTAVLPGESVFAYSNPHREVGIAAIDDSGKLISNSIILTAELLPIDPALCKTEDGYFLSYTNIDGNVNNADPAKENGRYTIRLLYSKDLKNWEALPDILSERRNLEDPDIFRIDDTLCVLAERETVDRGKSEIILMTSDDGGKHFSDPHILLRGDADQEPASIAPSEDGFTLFYSSDKANPGSSYDGMQALYATFDKSFQLKTKDIPIPTAEEDGILLYDAAVREDRLRILYAGEYGEEGKLTLEECRLT